MEIFTVAFFGHRRIGNLFEVKEQLYEHIINLMDKKEFVEFLVGRNGDFDQCAAWAVRKAKREHRDDNSALVLDLPYPTAEYLKNEKNFEEYYDGVEISASAARVHPKAAIQIRNREMADRANLIICFIEESFGGAYETVKYAESKNKKIINIVNEKT